MNRQRKHDTSAPESIDELFQQSRNCVPRDDIVAFAPIDPGYDDYVRLWSEIQRTGSVPTELSFDLREVIGMTSWGVASRWGDKVGRFIAFRRFTSAVALVLVHRGHDVDNVRPANYLARDLVIDQFDFYDSSQEVSLGTLREAIQDTRVLLRSVSDTQFPYFTLGAMILAQLEGDWTAAEQAASQLISDEQEARGFQPYSIPTDFLFGLTVYDQLNHDWRRMIAGLRNPNHHGETAMIIEALRQTSSQRNLL
jgi:hypothetical protein